MKCKHFELRKLFSTCVQDSAKDADENKKEMGQTQESQEANLVIDEEDYELNEERSDPGNKADSGIDADVESSTHTIQPDFRNGDSTNINDDKSTRYQRKWKNYKENMIRDGLIADDQLRGIICTLCGYESGQRTGMTRDPIQ